MHKSIARGRELKLNISQVIADYQARVKASWHAWLHPLPKAELQETALRQLASITDANNIPPLVLSACQKLTDNGHSAFIVGGAIRDLLLGFSPSDYDVSTSATPMQVKKLFGRQSQIIGRRYPVVHYWEARKRSQSIEIISIRKIATPWDTLTKGLDSNNIWCDDPREDARKRDLTVNAMYYDPISGKLLALEQGIKDLEQRVSRMIGNAAWRLREDPARIIRAIRLTYALDLSFEKSLEQALLQSAPLILELSDARLQSELSKLLVSRGSYSSLVHLKDMGLLPHLNPLYETLTEQDWGFIKPLVRAVYEQRNYWDHRLRKPLSWDIFTLGVVWSRYDDSANHNRGHSSSRKNKDSKELLRALVAQASSGKLGLSKIAAQMLYSACLVQEQLTNVQFLLSEEFLKRPSADLSLMLFAARITAGDVAHSFIPHLKKAQRLRVEHSTADRMRKKQQKRRPRRQV